MIRAALALTAGMAAASIYDSAVVRFFRRRKAVVKLNLITDAIAVVCDDIADAMHDGEWLTAEALTDFYTSLCCERDELQRLLRELQPLPVEKESTT